ncbi:MAG: STAS domain-containing protein [Armatimonadetes bacterium]|nr:STAS domain-containing protein [Armatimonadota bacterium]
MNLTVNSRPADQAYVIDLQGEVDVYTAPKLRQEIIGLLDKGINRVVINLSGVEYLDSTGLGVLIGGLKRLKEQGGNLFLICPNPKIKRIFEITGLDKIFSMFLTEKDAVGSLTA